MSKKRGFSQIIAMIFLILISLLAVTTFWIFTKDLISKQAEEIQSQASLNCIKGVDLEIIDACHKTNLLRVTLKNRRELTLGDFFLIQYYFEDGKMESVPTPPYTYLEGYETKEFIFEFKEATDKIKIIPKVENQVLLCESSAPEYSNIKECKDG